MDAVAHTDDLGPLRFVLLWAVLASTTIGKGETLSY